MEGTSEGLPICHIRHSAFQNPRKSFITNRNSYLSIIASSACYPTTVSADGFSRSFDCRACVALENFRIHPHRSERKRHPPHVSWEYQRPLPGRRSFELGPRQLYRLRTSSLRTTDINQFRDYWNKWRQEGWFDAGTMIHRRFWVRSLTNQVPRIMNLILQRCWTTLPQSLRSTWIVQFQWVSL